MNIDKNDSHSLLETNTSMMCLLQDTTSNMTYYKWLHTTFNLALKAAPNKSLTKWANFEEIRPNQPIRSFDTMAVCMQMEFFLNIKCHIIYKIMSYNYKIYKIVIKRNCILLLIKSIGYSSRRMLEKGKVSNAVQRS